MLPPSGLFFECVTSSVYEVGTVVEMTGIGEQRVEDAIEDNLPPFIWAFGGIDDDHDGCVDYYFSSDDLRPLTPAACDAYADLLALEHSHVIEPYQP
jgi:hypothetical protein